ncbi:MAG: DUF4381 domain-containing protein [Magnetococcales bacterium]|nr:DUF4381 domain-containing protein [Magnetococcales bacterium]
MNPTQNQQLPLHDIHLPQAISWWPLAPGWWYLFGLIIVLTGLIYAVWRWYKKGALRREALDNLAKIAERYKKTGNHGELAQELSILLRRVVISSQNRSLAAGLTGERWLQFLDTHNPVKDPKSNFSFQHGPGKILITAPYKPHVEKEEVENLLTLCNSWIKNSNINNYTSNK